MQGVLDVNGASPRRYFFEVLHHFATAELELDRLEYFSTPAGRDDLYTYNQKEGVHQLLLIASAYALLSQVDCVKMAQVWDLVSP